MKAIRIDIKNVAALDSALAAASDGARKHVFRGDDLFDIEADAERRLSLLLLKKDFSGARVVARSSRPVANAFRHKRVGVEATLERRATGWYLISLRRISLQTWQGGTRDLLLTVVQDAAAIRRLRTTYRVDATPPLHE